MSTRRKKIPLPRPGESFTLVDEMMASPVRPMPAADAADRVRDARSHLASLTHGAEPTTMDWKVCATVGNLIEIMLEFGLIQDDDGLLANAQRVLKDVAEHAITHNVAPRLVGAEVQFVEAIVDAYEHVLAELPHRTMLRVFRETDKRMRMVKLGHVRAGDYVAGAKAR